MVFEPEKAILYITHPLRELLHEAYYSQHLLSSIDEKAKQRANRILFISRLIQISGFSSLIFYFGTSAVLSFLTLMSLLMLLDA
jgi:hypothetical protein